MKKVMCVSYIEPVEKIREQREARESLIFDSGNVKAEKILALVTQGKRGQA